MNKPTTTRAVIPSAVYQPHAPLTPAEGRRVVGYERYAGMLVPVYEAPPAPPPPPAVVRRGVDVVAQRLAATGVCAAGIGWGVGQVLSPLTAGGGGALMWLVLLLLAARYRPTSRTTTTHITTHNHGWLAHSHTNKG